MKSYYFNQCQCCTLPAQKLICDSCLADLELFDWQSCNYNLMNRPDIRKGFAEPQFDSLLALAPYSAPFSHWLSKLKFNRQILLKELLVTLFQFHIKRMSCQFSNDAITVVPLHRWRWLWRGFNQSALIAKSLSRELSLPYQPELLSRQKYTVAQTALTARQRRNNLKQAFTVSTSVAGRSILLVDDVITTGSTANAICTLLKKQGAARVDLLVACIATL